MANLVAIVGRPNVGKSTLFNRLTKTRQAIVSDTAGTTRDRQYGKCEWNGREFSVVDTGGWVVKSDDIFEDAIRKQVIVATEEADLVLFLVDVQTGLTDWDQDVATILRRTKLPVILVANKTDNNDQIYDAAEFYALGLGEPQCISSATGSGTGDLLDLVLSKLKPDTKEEVEDGIPRSDRDRVRGTEREGHSPRHPDSMRRLRPHTQPEERHINRGIRTHHPGCNRASCL